MSSSGQMVGTAAPRGGRKSRHGKGGGLSRPSVKNNLSLTSLAGTWGFGDVMELRLLPDPKPNEEPPPIDPPGL
jgi:hypothetical protein